MTSSNQYEPPSFSDSAVESELGDKNLLVVSHQYNWFAKEQIDRLAEYFNEVHVFARANRLAKIGHIIGHEKLKNRSPKNKIDNKSPPDVVVHPTPLTYIPIDIWRRYLGKQHYLAVREQLSNIDVEFSVIHSHFSWTAGYVGTQLSEYLGIPNVISIHENEDRLASEIESENSLIYKGWEQADALIRVNMKDCNRLTKFNPSIYHIPNGFSRERYPLISTHEAKNQLNINPNTSVIFTLSMLHSRKNVSLLIEAINQLETSEPVYCAIGGRGPEQSQLQSKIDSLNVEHEIELLGYVSEEKLPIWMNSCDIFTLTSNSEGNPTVMFEALGCGKPYVGTNVGGVSEVITTDDYGLLSPPGNQDALCSNLQSAINRDWNRHQIRKYGEQFTWDQITRSVCDVFMKMVNNSEEETAKDSFGN